jgi:polyisoprenoid-binding protein YceI
VTAEPSPHGAWSFDTDRSTIGFAVRHMVVSKAHGRFTRWTGKIDFDETSPESSSVEVEIDAASVDTDDASRDAYLRSTDFLDVAAFPRIVFRSRRVERLGRRLRVTGLLTIRDLQRPITLDVTRTPPGQGSDRVRFVGEAVVERKAFGLRFDRVPDVGGVAVGNKIEVSIAVELVPNGRSESQPPRRQERQEN